MRIFERALALALLGIAALAAKADGTLAICNEGNRDLSVALLGAKTYFNGSADTLLSAWHAVPAGRCPTVIMNNALAWAVNVNVAFLRQANDGRFYPEKYSPVVDSDLRSRFRVAKFCVKKEGGEWKLPFQELVAMTQPPCASDSFELDTSFTALVRGVTMRVMVGGDDSSEAVSKGPRPLARSEKIAFGGRIVEGDFIRFARLSFPDHVNAYMGPDGAGRSIDEYPGADAILREVGHGNPPMLMCTYFHASELPAPTTRKFLFWGADLPSAEPGKLRSAHRYTPLLLIGKYRGGCPANEDEARAAIAGNLR